MGTCKVAVYSVKVFELIVGGVGLSETTSERLVQSKNALLPILVTLLGIVMRVTPVALTASITLTA